MKICLDITCLAVDNWTGVQNSYYDLITELVKNKKHEFIIFGLAPRGLLKKLYKLEVNNNKNVKVFILPLPSKLFNLGLTLIQRTQAPQLNLFVGDNIDVYLSGGYFWLPVRARMRICTVHDLCEDMDKFEINRLNYASRFSDYFIAPSKSTKNDFINKYKISSKNIEVINWGIDTDKFKDIKPKKIKNLENKKFFIAFGSADRKNIFKIKLAHKLSKTKHKLFVVGGDNYVSDSELKWLWENCSGLIYASTCEGFGLPILESFYFGKPVLTSNTSSMPEVGGDAVIYCDPNNIKEMAKSIKKLSKSKLNKTKAKKQLNKFSYEKSADKLLKFFNKSLS